MDKKTKSIFLSLPPLSPLPSFPGRPANLPNVHSPVGNPHWWLAMVAETVLMSWVLSEQPYSLEQQDQGGTREWGMDKPAWWAVTLKACPGQEWKGILPPFPCQLLLLVCLPPLSWWGKETVIKTCMSGSEEKQHHDWYELPVCLPADNYICCTVSLSKREEWREMDIERKITWKTQWFLL